MAPEVIKAKWGSKLSFWGCLGSQSVLTHGTPREIEQEIKRLYQLFKDDGGLVLAPAKPLVDEMGLDQAVAVIETLAELNT
jgi:uroporphyrinogen decarboxylase